MQNQAWESFPDYVEVSCIDLYKTRYIVWITYHLAEGGLPYHEISSSGVT